MSATVRQAGIRLSLQGAQEVTRGLREVGDAGERNLERVTQSAGAAGAALRLLGPILGGLGAGLGIGSVVGLAQDWAVRMGRDLLGVGEAAERARVSSEAFLASLADEGQGARNVIREINDLLLTSAQRAANAANAQRQALADTAAARLGFAMANQEQTAFALPEIERRIAEAERTLAAQRQTIEGGRRQGRMMPDAEGAAMFQNAEIDRLRAERNNLLVRMRADEGTIRELQAGMAGLAALPPVTAGGGAAGGRGGGRAAAPRDTSAQDAARAEAERERLLNDLNAYNQGLNLQAAGLSAAGPVLDAYTREMERLDAFLRAGAITQDDFAERVRVASEALEGQIDQASRAGRAVNELGRDMSRFGASAVSDLAKAAIAGKNLGDTFSNLAGRLGDLFLNRAFQQLFGGGGKGGGFDIFGTIFGAVGGAFGGLGGGAGGGGASVGFRANGGPVEAGRPYIVGERRPELFIPRSSGTVMPSAGGGAPVVVNQTLNFGSDISRAEFERRAQQIERRTFAAVVEARREDRKFLA
jgi:hypothetical protein